jgi:hypothetical protein
MRFCSKETSWVTAAVLAGLAIASRDLVAVSAVAVSIVVIALVELIPNTAVVPVAALRLWRPLEPRAVGVHDRPLEFLRRRSRSMLGAAVVVGMVTVSVVSTAKYIGSINWYDAALNENGDGARSVDPGTAVQQGQPVREGIACNDEPAVWEVIPPFEEDARLVATFRVGHGKATAGGSARVSIIDRHERPLVDPFTVHPDRPEDVDVELDSVEALLIGCESVDDNGVPREWVYILVDGEIRK